MMIESGDVVLLGNDLLKFVETLNVARRCRRIIMANFAGTLLVDGVGVGCAAYLHRCLTPMKWAPLKNVYGKRRRPSPNDPFESGTAQRATGILQVQDGDGRDLGYLPNRPRSVRSGCRCVLRLRHR